mmetsp:Transcript_22449/g.68420  ORF Transcript_22449/g.68420 Transcript_22449/m.68420 type:complete len:84 (+) Transcript_22449:307-558(+)
MKESARDKCYERSSRPTNRHEYTHAQWRHAQSPTWLKPNPTVTPPHAQPSAHSVAECQPVERCWRAAVVKGPGISKMEDISTS